MFIPAPALSTPHSWFPGHMSRFTRMLPALLSRTDVVLELRDARLPLTSINPELEGALQQWKTERALGKDTSLASKRSPIAPHHSAVCERLVVFNKRDLVPEWGIQPFQAAMHSRFPDQKVFFASWNRGKDIKALNDLLVKVARSHPDATELNVLVVGMPNVGKSTLLNALRNYGIPGPTPKALRTSSHPGMTRALSTRLKLSQEPLVYAYDSPGVMVPFLGRGARGEERGIKLALIAGIKEGLYEIDTLANYLFWQLWKARPDSPTYLSLLLPSDSMGKEPHPESYSQFIEMLARKLGMLKKGGILDTERAAGWFVRWWRDGKDLKLHNASDGTVNGWGFDFDWSMQLSSASSHDHALSVSSSQGVDPADASAIQARMEASIDVFVSATQKEVEEGGTISASQERKKELDERRELRERTNSGRGGGGGRGRGTNRRGIPRRRGRGR